MTPPMVGVLVALSERDQHGYALIDHVAQLSAGGLVLGAGTLYRTLQRLRVDAMIVEIDPEPAAEHTDRRAERRRRYRITAAGRAAVAEELWHLHALVASGAARRLLADHAEGVREDAG